MQKIPQVRSRFEEDDVFVVDRGFRNAVPYLKSKGFVIKMPELIPAYQSQLSDLSANRSRLVTKIRFVVDQRSLGNVFPIL